MRDRFLRCIDLYMAPRQRILRKARINPEDLLPQLPSTQELKPFPSRVAVIFKAPDEEDREKSVAIECVGISPCGQWVATAKNVRKISRKYVIEENGKERDLPIDEDEMPEEDKELEGVIEDYVDEEESGDKVDHVKVARQGIVRIWETRTGRCIRKHVLSSAITCIAFSPRRDVCVLALTCGKELCLYHPGLGCVSIQKNTTELLSGLEFDCPKGMSWEFIPSSKLKLSTRQYPVGIMIRVKHAKPLSFVKWHCRGDYCLTVSPTGVASAITVHRISNKRSLYPFKSYKGSVVSAAFHPYKPVIFVCTKTGVRMYHLEKQAIIAHLLTGVKWSSGMDIHMSGEHILVSGLDGKCVWMDMELGNTPYKTMEPHTSEDGKSSEGVRNVAFHSRYPLFISGGDDGCVHVFHGKIFESMERSPLIIPIKRISCATSSVRDICWHPIQPWFIAGCSNGLAKLYT
eukprot:gnl/Carplike_NY0171/2760_a3710_628.p1 GENE.gnl/Carplike_NY0171/2760_a3710_628~~gnl/Carplike_NY0171/2760_a3710_628.p1  ORF type:complete len:522 (+),score=105.88 gnl/Carplike_NY0171/2760_a3710_628:188-1567(+)